MNALAHPHRKRWLGPKGQLTRPIRLIKLPAVLDRSGGSKSEFYRLVNANKAPAPIHRGRLVYWVEEEIDNWLAELVAAPGGAIAKGA